MNPLHYPSLELCKKLTEEGFPNTEKCWARSLKWDDTKKTFPYELSSRPTPWGYYVAASVMELLDELPCMISWENKYLSERYPEKDIGYILFMQKYYHCYRVSYFNKFFWDYKHYIDSKNYADSLAKMWLWLKENDLLPKK